MAGYGKVRQLVTGDSGMDTFIREVRTSLGELHDAVGASAASSSRIVPWDSNHTLAFSFSAPEGTGTVKNEGTAGSSYTLRLGGAISPRFGFPSPFGGAVEFASESTTSSSYITGCGTFPTSPNNYSVECMLFTHFAPYDMPGGFPGYVPFCKLNVALMTLPQPGPPTSLAMTVYSGAGGTGAIAMTPAQYVTFPTGQWNHVMFTASSTNGKKLYMNGQLIYSSSNTTDTVTNTNDWVFGAGDTVNTYKFYGAIARWAYSNTVRPRSYAIQVTNAMRGW